jgi:hypothetical protein
MRGGWFGASGTGGRGRGRGEGEHEPRALDIEIAYVEAAATEAKQVGARRVSDEVTTGFHSYLSMQVPRATSSASFTTGQPRGAPLSDPFGARRSAGHVVRSDHIK